MNDTTHEPDTPVDEPRVITTTPTPAVVVQSAEPADGANRGFSFGSFLLGFLTALLAAAIAVGVFLAVSDSDDDGNIELDVPAVDVDIDN